MTALYCVKASLCERIRVCVCLWKKSVHERENETEKVCTYVCVHVCVCVYAKACFLSTSTWETDLHTLVEQLEDSWVADQTVYVLLQALSQPTQQVQSNNHEVFIWWVILFWLRQVGLQAPFNITLTGTSWSKLIMDPLMLKNTTTNKKTNNKKQNKKKKDKEQKKRRANAQTIHIRHTYSTSSQLSSLINQTSWTLESLHATLQQNECTRILAFPYQCDHEWTSRSFKLEPNCRVS